MNQRGASGRSVSLRAIYLQVIAYGILFILIVADEVVDIPHKFLGVPPTPINWGEALLEGLYVIFLAVFSVYLSWRYLSRIKILEGFLPICAICKKIRKKGKWTSLEDYMSEHSEARFSHGLCPECASQHYGEFTRPTKPALGASEGEDQSQV